MRGIKWGDTALADSPVPILYLKKSAGGSELFVVDERVIVDAEIAV